MVARAVQRSPFRVAVAAIVAWAPESTRRNSNEPLGARVTFLPEAARAPFLLSVTFHGTPLRFWSTSNSTSMPLSSISA